MTLDADIASRLKRDANGQVDVVVTSLQAPAEVWANRTPDAGHWLGVRLIGTKSNRDGIGAVITIAASADPRWARQWNHMTTAVGYANAVPASREFIPDEIKNDPVVFPPADAKLYTPALATQSYERSRNRLWTRIKAGR